MYISIPEGVKVASLMLFQDLDIDKNLKRIEEGKATDIDVNRIAFCVKCVQGLEYPATVDTLKVALNATLLYTFAHEAKISPEARVSKVLSKYKGKDLLKDLEYIMKNSSINMSTSYVVKYVLDNAPKNSSVYKEASELEGSTSLESVINELNSRYNVSDIVRKMKRFGYYDKKLLKGVVEKHKEIFQKRLGSSYDKLREYLNN
jgi:hypothetical protein